MEFVFWALTLAPAVPFVALSLSYRRIVEQKIREVSQRVGAFEAEYTRAYGSAKEERRDIRKELEEFYDWRTYTVPLLVTCLVSCSLAFVALLYLGERIGTPALAREAARIEPTVLVGAGGAYLWGLYDVLRRHRSADISSTALHFVWVRIVVAGAIGAAIARTFEDPVDIYVALAVAGLPIESIKDWVIERANLSVRSVQVAPDELHLIRGMTARLRSRLADEDIDSVESLAFADPVRLLFRTNIEWNVILDLVDQASLVHYVGGDVASLAPHVRGAIDLASLYQRATSEDDDSEDRANARAVLSAVGTRLQQSEAVAHHLGYLMYHDPLVQFVWTHWEAARPWNEDDDAEGGDEAVAAGTGGERREDAA